MMLEDCAGAGTQTLWIVHDGNGDGDGDVHDG